MKTEVLKTKSGKVVLVQGDIVTVKTKELSRNPICGFDGEGIIIKSADPRWSKWGVCFPNVQTEWFSDLLEAQTKLGKLRKANR